MDNLAGLRDIHLPEDTSFWWPIAYGWWGVLIVFTGIVIAFYAGKKVWQASAKFYTQRILLSLKDDTELSAAIKMSEILRRVCVRQYPEAVALVGNDWIDFLNKKSKKMLDANAAELLKNAPFIAPKSSNFSAHDMQNLWQFCYEWVGENL
ncbi:MAG: DUF4381 domain-containing protein [Alphaproteobacteria bacterium]|nr:DUF4381 domain-containing protein [Alphaproteobacteria bacterium]